MDTALFQVDGLRCTGCTETVTAMLRAEPGVLAAEVSLERREARVLFDPARTDRSRLVKVIERPGYRATERRANAGPGDA